MESLIEFVLLLAGLALTLAALAFIAGASGAARTLGRWGFALLLLAFLMPTLVGLAHEGVRRARGLMPSFEGGHLRWGTVAVVGVGHLSFGVWYFTRERRALARRAAADEARRAHQRERERLAPPFDGGAA